MPEDKSSQQEIKELELQLKAKKQALKTNKTGGGFNKPQLILPASILLAGLIVGGAFIYTRSGQRSYGATAAGGQVAGAGVGGVAGLGGGHQQPPSDPADIKLRSGDHIRGDKNAKVTVVEYGDFRCPFCERWFQQVEPPLKTSYVDAGKVKMIFRNYAFLGPQSTWAAEAAECGAEQGKFWEFHDWLYSNQAPESDLAYYSKANLIKYAGQVGLGNSQFASCLNSDKYARRVADDLAQGQKDGVTGTPTVFINGQRVVGAQPFNVFSAIIDSILK